MMATIDIHDDLLALTIGRSHAVGVLLRTVMEGKRHLVQPACESAGTCPLPSLSVGDPNGEGTPEPPTRQDLAEIICRAGGIGKLPSRNGDLVPSSELSARGEFP